MVVDTVTDLTVACATDATIQVLLLFKDNILVLQKSLYLKRKLEILS